ncbi:MAG: fibronectin type III domain-containing protein, partial [Bacteroidales bacterium]|nr:fibronectin type III domain-containing protein [Bacteroidales bacterium]
MRKLFLTFVTALLCSIVSFAQFAGGNGTEGNPYLISTKAQFEAIAQQSNGASGKYFRQTADIDLGVYVNRASSIISTFRGTYDGDGHTITYQASFNGNTYDGNYALFGLVEGGTLENINVNADVTISGTQNNMQVALLCGKLTNRRTNGSRYYGIIRNCNVNGNINSTVSAEGGGGTDAGLLVGESQGQIKYCNGNGNVRGLGYVGGLIGQMSKQSNNYESSVIGSSFIGTVTADSPSTDYDNDPRYGSFAGGICGYANTNTKITLCYVSASINLGNHNADVNNQESGIASTALSGGYGKPTVTNNYAEGTINGVPIENAPCGSITNSTGNTSHNYYPGGSTTNANGTGSDCTTTMSSQEIAEALNNAANAAGESENIHFSPVGDGNVIFGQVSKVCEAPTNLTITNNEGTYTATWTSADADNTIEEATWHWSLTGGNLNVASQGSITTTTISSQLDPSPNPYTFTVYTDCSAFDTENSQSVSSTFTVACPTPTGLTASNITDNGFDISWDADVDCQLTVNGNNYEISAGNTMEKQITGLDPQTTYNIIVEAKCGGEYVEQATTNVTTARLAAPTGLAVNTVWNGSVGSGTATITWDEVDGLKYEIEGQTGDKESGFAISNLAENNYTLRLRAKKGTKTSDWVSMPYTISSPDAPKYPQVEYTRNGNEYNVTVSWTAGSTENDGWIVNGGEVQNTASYVLTAQTPGYITTLSIVEKVGESTSGALQVPIQVPCLPATEPNTVSTTQTSATFTFSHVIEGRKVIIGSNAYPASATSITIDGLTSGTTYSYEVREYCNETQYSSVIANFATVGCFAVKNLSVSDIGVTNATISWGSQSTLAGLNYQITVNGETKPEQTATTITLTGLTSATEYNIIVKEQCGEGWGEERTITFTTESGNYVTAKDGDFDFPDTWAGNKVPTGKFGNITIKHNVTLSHSLTLSGSCRISNEGVLKITSQGELINTTGNNVGGIIEVETPQKDMNKWTFIGAPFESGYKLGSIKPVSGSDVAMVEYNYTDGEWSNYFVNYETTMSAAEGAFAWMFYNGVVTFSTYDLGRNGTTYPANADADYVLNNTDVTVTETLRNSESSPGYWMALANPYPAKLSVSEFLGDNTLQGNCVY